ncbi:hypothetical protein BD293_4000 [Roseinatronobacter monicus]|uniref:Uncharacterized protein n=1 Tax=Roseinatronobacter monicus TaxID=393481 RepID=A0A543K4S4_9RHOB|nr:hypothetical protein BD293_4000 [Roseinatronobacter monicus]
MKWLLSEDSPEALPRRRQSAFALSVDLPVHASPCLRVRNEAPAADCPCSISTWRNVLCGWLLHCKRFLSMFAVIFVSTVVCPACLCFGIASTGPDEFRERGSNRLIDLRGP